MYGRSVIISILLTGFARAQQGDTPGDQLKFDVASVRQVQGANVPHAVSFNTDHGRFNVEAATLKQIAAFAYGVQSATVQGGPDWLASDRFDIRALSERDVSPRQLNEMVRSLLSDRFRLTVQRQTKELAGYALVPAKSGPRLTVAKPEEPTNFSAAMNRLAFRKAPIIALANYLANLAGTPVWDLTGLTELYDFELDLTPPVAAVADTRAERAPAVDRFSRVSVAVEEQLGLNVVPRKGPSDVVVISHAEHPSAN